MSKGCGMGPAAPRPTGAAMARRRAPGLGSAAASCSHLDAAASAPLHGAAAATAAAAAAPRSGSAAARWNQGKRDRRSDRGRSSLPPRLCLALLSLTLAALLPSAARAQQEICSCVPTRYTFELDLAAVCPPPGVTVGDDAGIDRFFCRTDVVESDPDLPEDLVPVSISSYIVLELDQELEVMKQFFRGDLDLGQGDTFEYVSVTDRADVGPGDIPGALQMSLTGRNAAGDQITAQWIITFTNLCDVMALSEGDFMSWAKFVELSPPPRDICPVAPEPPLTPAPFSLPPATNVTPAPVSSVTSRPTRRPTPAPRPPSPAPPSPSSMSMRRLDEFGLMDEWLAEAGEGGLAGLDRREKKGGVDRRLRRRNGRVLRS